MLDKNEFAKAFGNSLRTIAFKKNMKVKDISEASGLCHSTVWSYFWFGGNPNLFSAYKLAVALGVPISELVGALDE